MADGKIILNAGVVLLDSGGIILVQEAEAPFTGKWNFPLGKVEPDETLPDAAKREVLEEAGLQVELTNFLGVYQNLPFPGMNVILIMFVGKIIGGEIKTGNNEILQAKKFTFEEFAKLKDEELFHPEMRNAAKRALENPQPIDSYIKF